MQPSRCTQILLAGRVMSSESVSSKRCMLIVQQPGSCTQIQLAGRFMSSENVSSGRCMLVVQQPSRRTQIQLAGRFMSSESVSSNHLAGSLISSESVSSERYMLVVQVLEACLSTGAMRNTRVPTLPKSPLSPDKRIARLQAEETSSAASSTASKGSSHFGGHQFWGALQNAGLEREV